MKKIPLTIFLIGLSIMTTIVNAQINNTLEQLINNNYEKLLPVIEELDKYELQILYTKIDRNKSDKVYLTTYSFNEKPHRYFYPASTVKFAAAVLTLEKLNDLNIDGVNKYTHLSIDSLYDGHISFPKEYRDECGKPNIANYIKQIFLVSDNESFNRLYDFLGQKEISERLRKRGFNNTKIVHRLSVARTIKQNIETNPFKFYDEDGKLLYEQPARFDSTNVELSLTDTKKGVGYYSDGKLVEEPKDFSENNYFSLRDQHNLMIRIMFPEQFEEEARFSLTKDDYTFLKKYMSMLPKDSECPKYPVVDYWDSKVKFLMFGDSKEPMPSNIKIFNKVGLAYGYLTDNGYIVDKENNVEFFLSATLHVNENQIFNDDKYEYDEIALPFLAELGQVIYEHEKNRQ
jgi:Beta-lactamase enzyme family